MGHVYQRGRLWWLSYIDAAGKRQRMSADTDDEAVANAALLRIERRIAAEKASGTDRPWTVERYAKERWLPARKARGVTSTWVDEDKLVHIYPAVGHLKLADVTRRDVLEMVRALVAMRDEDGSAKYAPRTIRHVYGVLRNLFADAVADELVGATPCTLSVKRKELPPNIDADPAWRSRAVFTRGEAEQLISDERVPQDRRVLYALLFLGGLRINETTVRRWRDYDPRTEPLGRLEVDSSYQKRIETERAGTKAGPARAVPVHPTLAAILAEWRTSGWQAHVGRVPQPSDYIVPDAAGDLSDSDLVLYYRKRDFAELGLRLRRLHDMRRTFITLARAGGADKDTLRWVTHGPERGDIMDAYTTPPWSMLCEQVSKLRLERTRGSIARLHVRGTGKPQGEGA